MRKQRNLIRIVPPQGKEGEPLLSMGTKVFLGDKELDGVSSVQLVAEVGAFWQAVVTFSMIEKIDPITAEVDITSLKDESRHYGVGQRYE